VPNLELDLCLDLTGHLVTRANACAFHSMNNRWLYERRDQSARPENGSAQLAAR